MPRVGFAMPQQGFRPRTNPLGALGAIGLLGLGAENTFSGCVTAVDSQGNPVACGDPSAAVWFDVNMNAVAPGTPAVGGAGPAAGVPPGSVLTYSGQWPITLSKSLDTVMGSVNDFVRSQGISITSSQPKVGLFDVRSFPIRLQLLITGVGFAQPNDVRSIVDHACYLATGTMPYSSSISVVSIPVSVQAGQAAAQGYTPPAGCDPGINPNCGSQSPQTLTQWLESNALWIGLGVVAVAVLPTIARKF